MLLGRLLSDRLAEAFEPSLLLRAGGALGSLGMVLALAVAEPPAALVGFAALGAGLWMLCAAGGLFAVAWLGVQSDGSPVRRGLALAAVLAAVDGGWVPVEAAAVHAPGGRTTSASTPLGAQPELTFVIPTLDSASARVQRCIAAVQGATEVAHEIVIVDNGAPPQGFSAPVNAGLRAARTPYAVVMNDDVEVLAGWWEPLRAALDAGAPVAFPVTEDGANRADFAAWCFGLTTATIERHGHAPGEFFDPALCVWYQDTDLLTRLRAAGTPPVLVAQSTIRHGLSETVASDDPALRAWIQDQVQRDRMAFERKHGGDVAGAAR